MLKIRIERELTRLRDDGRDPMSWEALRALQAGELDTSLGAVRDLEIDIAAMLIIDIAEAKRQALVGRVAKRYASILWKWLRPEQMAEVNEDSDVNEHDFCDANMAMLEATEALGVPMHDTDNETISTRHTDVCNGAAAMAAANKFWEDSK